MRSKAEKQPPRPSGWASLARSKLTKSGGVRPTVVTLKKKGLGNLICAKQKRPELFAHLKQDKKNTSPEEWVLIAENLVEKHGRQAIRKEWLE